MARHLPIIQRLSVPAETSILKPSPIGAPRSRLAIAYLHSAPRTTWPACSASTHICIVPCTRATVQVESGFRTRSLPAVSHIGNLPMLLACSFVHMKIVSRLFVAYCLSKNRRKESLIPRLSAAVLYPCMSCVPRGLWETN